MDLKTRSVAQQRVVASVPFRKNSNVGGHKQDPRKKQLERYLAKEAQRSKKDRLKDILVQRLQNKYPGSMNKIVIISFVEEFVEKRDRVDERDLVQLERDVRDAVKSTAARTKAMKDKGQTVSGNALPASYAGTDRTSRAELRAEDGSSGAKAPASEAPAIAPGQEWVVLQGYNLIKADEEKAANEAKARKKKSDFKRALDDHISLANKIKAGDNADEQSYYKHIMTDIEKWKLEESDKAHKIEGKAAVQLAAQKEQMKLKADRLAAEREKEYGDANRDIQRIKRETEEEARSIEEAKAADRERNARVKAINAQNLMVKEENLAKLKVEDTKRMEEAMIRQEKEERERSLAFERRMEEMAKYGAVYAGEGAGKKARAKEVEMERIQIRDQLAKNAADEKRESDKQRKRKEDNKRTLDYNQNIIDRKAADAQAQAQEDKKFADFFETEQQKWKQSELDKKSQGEKKKNDYKKILDEHIEIRSSKDVNLTGMGQQELLINGQKLREVVNDQSLYTKVQNKLTGKDKPKGGKNNNKSRKPY